MHAKKSTVKEF